MMRSEDLWTSRSGTECNGLTAPVIYVDNVKKQIATLKETWQTSFIYGRRSRETDEVK